MKHILIFILFMSGLVHAETTDLVRLEQERKWSLKTDLSEAEIGQVTKWMENSKQGLEDLLKMVENEDDVDGRLRLLEEGLKRIMLRSFPKNTELQMRVILHRAQALATMVSQESQENSFAAKRFNVKFLISSIKNALRYYEHDLAYLKEKEGARDMAKFGRESYQFFMEEGKKIFDLSAQYQFTYNVMGLLKVDLFRSEYNKTPEVARLISQLHTVLNLVPKKPQTDEEARRGLRRLLTTGSELKFVQVEARESWGPTFVRIKAGTFMAGSPRGEIGRDENEKQAKVTLTRDFELMATEVTQKMFENVMTLNPSRFRQEKNCPETFDREKTLCPTHPVEHVSWDAVQVFINKLNQSQGLNCGDQNTKEGFEIAWKTAGCYRLPTEAEWEYAARAGTSTAYSFGNDPSELSSYGFYNGNSGGQTHPVASKGANPWGLYDMHGNVNEWVRGLYGYVVGGKDPMFLNDLTYHSRSVRGGGCYSEAAGVRSAKRYAKRQFNSSEDVGFRLARTL